MQSLEAFTASLAEAIFVSAAAGPEPLGYVGIKRFNGPDGGTLWRAHQNVNGRRVNLGVWNTAEEAASVVDIARITLGWEPRNYSREVYDAVPPAALKAARDAVCDRIRIYLH